MSRIFWAVLVVSFVTAFGSCAADQIPPTLQLLAQEWVIPEQPSQILPGPQEVIEVPPDHIQRFFAHIIWPGHEGERVHIEEVSWHWSADPPEGAWSEVIGWEVGYCYYVTVCEPFPWNVVHTVGTPCTYITFQADVVFTSANGVVYGPIWSNTVTKHIIPEPASLVALGFGLAAFAGCVRRSR